MATQLGEIKKVSLKEFISVRSNGLIAMDLEKGDELIATKLARKDDEVVLITAKGQAIRFAMANLRTASRKSGGIRGIKLSSGDHVVGMDLISPGCFLFTITGKGFGKRTSLKEYRPQRRGGYGLKAHRLTPKTGQLVTVAVVHPSQELIIVSKNGLIIRTPIKDIPCQNRTAQGVSVMRLEKDDSVVSIACLDKKSA
jgi:DNA gyrase subunit A